jgi:hypothetical protein
MARLLLRSPRDAIRLRIDDPSTPHLADALTAIENIVLGLDTPFRSALSIHGPHPRDERGLV